MTVLRTTRVVTVGALACALAWGSAAAVDLPRPLSGTVLDPSGRGLPKVEVFLVPDSGKTDTSARVSTDDLGRFLLGDVAPGVYRIAAVKQGYGVFLDRINTGLRSSLDVVLHPLPRPGEPSAAAIADDASWALRIPRRSVWNDVAPGPLENAPATREAGPVKNGSPALATLVDGRVDQWVSLAAPRIGVWSGGVQGSETRMALAGAVGERTRVLVDGSRSTLTSEAPLDDSAAVSASRGSTDFNVGVRHQTSPEAILDVRAYWSARDFETVVAADTGQRRAANVWGYDASWTQQIDPESTLAVRMDFASATVDGGANAFVDDPGPATIGVGAVSHRAVGAAGTYETLPSYGHVVRVAFGARFADVSAPTAVLPVARGVAGAWGEGDGWDVRIRAEDTWTVAGPVSIIYGLGYRHRIAAGDEVALVVPALGTAWTSARGAIRGVLTYHDESVRIRDAEASALGPRAERDGIGYEVSGEVSLPLDVTVHASVSRAPARTDPIDGGDASAVGAIYVPTFESAVRERSAGVSYETGAVQLFLDWARGQVEGESTAILPYDLAFQVIAPTTLSYRTGRVGIRVPASGTRIQIEHRRILDRPFDVETWGGAREQDQYELRLVQDLVRSSPGVSWRLLVSLQAAELDEAAVAYASALQGEQLPASHRQVNTGVSLAF